MSRDYELVVPILRKKRKTFVQTRSEVPTLPHESQNVRLQSGRFNYFELKVGALLILYFEGLSDESFPALAACARTGRRDAQLAKHAT